MAVVALVVGGRWPVRIGLGSEGGEDRFSAVDLIQQRHLGSQVGQCRLGVADPVGSQLCELQLFDAGFGIRAKRVPLILGGGFQLAGVEFGGLRPGSCGLGPRTQLKDYARGCFGWQAARVRVDRVILFRLATSERLERSTKALPGGAAAAWRAASRYVAGRTREEGLRAAAEVLERGHGVSVDLFGEHVHDVAQSAQAGADYLALASALPPAPADAWLSVDLSHLAVQHDPAGAAQSLAAVAAALPPGRRIQVGAEEAEVTDAVLGCVTDVASRGLADRLGATVQANLLRSPGDVDKLIAAGVHIRLVKGAYLERAGALAFGEPTDVAFLRLAHQLAAAGATWSMATHDGRLREAVHLALGPVPVEQLHGVRPEILDDLRALGVPTRVYLPYGPDWFRYWLRRVAESRGA